MFFRGRSELTHFTHMRASYCKFMICLMRGNLHIKILFTIFCMCAGLAIAYYHSRIVNEKYEVVHKITDLKEPISNTP